MVHLLCSYSGSVRPRWDHEIGVKPQVQGRGPQVGRVHHPPVPKPLGAEWGRPGPSSRVFHSMLGPEQAALRDGSKQVGFVKFHVSPRSHKLISHRHQRDFGKKWNWICQTQESKSQPVISTAPVKSGVWWGIIVIASVVSQRTCVPCGVD
jgi:hypothetical protein